MRHLFSLLALAFATTAAPASETIQAVDADSGLYAEYSADGWTVNGQSSAPVQLSSLPRGYRPSKLTPTLDGWVLTGHATGGDGTDLLILRSVDGQIETLPSLTAPANASRGNPVAAVDEGRLIGIAWLEGSRQSDLTVRAASWNGTAWGPIQTVSARGRGAQVALDSAVLWDGSWLLVWSAFDGEDDEIVWSRWAGAGWSPPMRLHDGNQVPDITPALMATNAGAVVAWSVYDGNDYRLRLGHFDGTGWTVSPLRGARGSISPQVRTRGDSYFVLHRTVIPDGWSLLDVDANGRPTRSATIDRPVPDPPLLLPVGKAEVEIRWPADAAQRSRPRWESLP